MVSTQRNNRRGAVKCLLDLEANAAAAITLINRSFTTGSVEDLLPRISSKVSKNLRLVHWATKVSEQFRNMIAQSLAAANWLCGSPYLNSLLNARTASLALLSLEEARSQTSSISAQFSDDVAVKKPAMKSKLRSDGG